MEVDKEIKNIRSSSREKRLSANKSRVTSPSPKKKRWDAPAKPDSEPPSKALEPAQKLPVAVKNDPQHQQ